MFLVIKILYVSINLYLDHILRWSKFLKSLYILDSFSSSQVKTFHLAEGPGGFIEAVCNVRDNPKDLYYGMTLISDKDYVPGWKKSQDYLKAHPNIILEYGKDNTGDIMNPENLRFIREKYGNSMDLVTGDGGFDFSVNFNDQETSASKLILAQIIYAIFLQKENGSFMIKFFDIFYVGPQWTLFIFLVACIRGFI